MIVSNDSIIVRPPYDITPAILKLITSISEKIGEINANYLNKPSTSRDLKKGVEIKLFEKTGKQNKTKYRLPFQSV